VSERPQFSFEINESWYYMLNLPALHWGQKPEEEKSKGRETALTLTNTIYIAGLRRMVAPPTTGYGAALPRHWCGASAVSSIQCPLVVWLTAASHFQVARVAKFPTSLSFYSWGTMGRQSSVHNACSALLSNSGLPDGAKFGNYCQKSLFSRHLPNFWHIFYTNILPFFEIPSLSIDKRFRLGLFVKWIPNRREIREYGECESFVGVYYCRSWCCAMLHYSLEVVYFLWPCISLSTFHLLPLLADARTDDA